LSTLFNTLVRLLITIVLVIAGIWLVRFNWQQKGIRQKNYTYTALEAKRLKPFPEAQYAYGQHAWLQNDAETAAAYFKQAVSDDVFYMDAWLKLAEAEISLGRPEVSRAILKFSDKLTAGVFRWKWAQMLLAMTLKKEDLLLRNANYLLEHAKLQADTLQLLDVYYGGDTAAAAGALESENLMAYLQWLMRWDRVEDTELVWRKISADSKPQPKDLLN
jgi:hypothetical protein